MTWSFIELLVFLCATQYLLGEATIFDRLRGRLPAFFQELLACPSCCGFWLGLAFAAVRLGPWGDGSVKGTLLTGLASVALTPMGRGLMALGWAVSQSGHDHHDHDHDHAGEAVS